MLQFEEEEEEKLIAFNFFGFFVFDVVELWKDNKLESQRNLYNLKLFISLIIVQKKTLGVFYMCTKIIFYLKEEQNKKQNKNSSSSLNYKIRVLFCFKMLSKKKISKKKEEFRK